MKNKLKKIILNHQSSILDYRKAFTRQNFPKENLGGFTLIETLVVLGILTMLASILISYNGTARQQDALTIETNKIAQVISLAKSLTMSTYASDAGSYCGYGVYFNLSKDSSSVCGSDSYCIFHYPSPPPGDITACETIAAPISLSGVSLVSNSYSYSMNSNVQFDQSNSNPLQAVLFVPPQPKIFLDPQPSNGAESGIVSLKTADGKSGASVTVSSGGQISFQ